jgi:probable phosphomutase (TIGR03848 family)
VSTVVLVRHGRTHANTSGVLAGWSSGVFLDEEGEEQVQRVAAALADIPVTAVITSPLDRTQQTAEAILAAQRAAGHSPQFHVEPRIGECRYGEWTGRALADLAQEPLWSSVQAHPSSVTFPGAEGESMLAMQHRATSAIREWNATLGEEALSVVVSHGDVIKAVLADALGMHLDHFQRIHIDPASLSVIHYTPHRPFVFRTNSSSESIGAFIQGVVHKRKAGSSDAEVGGGAGT